MFDYIIPRDYSSNLKLPRFARAEERRALTPEEKKAILRTIKEHPDGMLLSVLYYLGVRRGEALWLMWGDFDWDNNLVHIQRDIDFVVRRSEDPSAIGALKTKAADREVFIPDELRKILFPERGFPTALLFPSPNGNTLGKTSFERKWISIMRHAGMIEPREKEKEWSRNNERADWRVLLTPHMLRHNYVTMLYEAGVDPLIVSAQ